MTISGRAGHSKWAYARQIRQAQAARGDGSTGRLFLLITCAISKINLRSSHSDTSYNWVKGKSVITSAMHRPVVKFLILILALVLLAGTVTLAQADLNVCPALVQRALQMVSSICSDQSRNSACYGHQLVRAQFVDNQPPGIFDAEGDIVPIELLRSIKTAPLEAGLLIWGVSILSLQADIPGTLPGQNAILMLLGGAEIESAIQPGKLSGAAVTPVSISAVRQDVLREQPASDANLVQSITLGTPMLADARTTDGSFLRVTVDGDFGWLDAGATNIDPTILNALPIHIPGESFTPMQAFYLRTGIGATACVQAPSALIVQGPHNLHVDIRVNGADINLGSTLILRTYSLEEAEQAGLGSFGDVGAGGVFELSVIDGRATVRNADGSPVYIDQGEHASICLDQPVDSGIDGQPNDQTITYACGGWTAPSPIAASLRDEFAIIDGYSLIYPIDLAPTPPPVRPGLMTNAAPPVAPVPTAPPPPVQPPPPANNATICHNGETLTLPPEAAAAHLNSQGNGHANDHAGPC